MERFCLLLFTLGCILCVTNCTFSPKNSENILAEIDGLMNNGINYEEMKRPDSAYICYQEAINRLQNSREHNRLVELYFKVGEILYKHSDYESAKIKYRKAMHHTHFITDKTMLSKSYRMLGKMHGFQHQFDSTLHYYQLAYHLREQVSEQERADITNNLSAVYLRIGLLDSALHYNTLALSFNIERSLRIYDFYARAQIFEKLGELDSSAFYMKTILQEGDAKFKVLACHHLIKMSGQLKDSDSVSYLQSYIYWKDSLERINLTVNVVNEKNLIERKRIDKYYTAEKQKYVLFSLFLLIVVSLIVWLIMTLRRGKIHRELLALKENLLGREAVLCEMEEKLLKMQQSNNEKDKELEVLKVICEKNRQALQKDARTISLNLSQKGREASKRLNRQLKFKDCKNKLILATKSVHQSFTAKDSDELFACILAEFDSFIMDLKYFSLFKRNDDYVYICTFFLDFSPKEYQLLYHIEDNSIRMKRKRLREKMKESIVGEELARLLFVP